MYPTTQPEISSLGIFRNFSRLPTVSYSFRALSSRGAAQDIGSRMVAAAGDAEGEVARSQVAGNHPVVGSLPAGNRHTVQEEERHNPDLRIAGAEEVRPEGHPIDQEAVRRSLVDHQEEEDPRSRHRKAGEEAHRGLLVGAAEIRLKRTKLPLLRYMKQILRSHMCAEFQGELGMRRCTRLRDCRPYRPWS